MNTYESTIICLPELPQESIDEIIEKIKKIVDESKGEVLSAQNIGRKRLAYPINKVREGVYVFMELKGSGDMTGALESFYKLNESIIRYLTVKVDKIQIKPQKPEPVKDDKTTSQEVVSNEQSEPQTAGTE